MNFSSALALYFFAAHAIGRSQLTESKMKTNRALLAGFSPLFGRHLHVLPLSSH